MLLIRALIFAIAASGAHAASAGWQDTPDSLHLQAMGDAIKMNGVPMQLRAFSSDLPLEAVVGTVRTGWERGQAAVVTRSTVGGWTVLNQSVGTEHRSFQVRPNASGSVDGFVALTSPKQASEPKVAVRLPADMRPLSIIDSVDQGRVSQQVVAVSSRSVDATANALEASLKAAGWERHVFKKQGTSIVFAANKGGQQFDATFTAQQPGSLVYMNTTLQSR